MHTAVCFIMLAYAVFYAIHSKTLHASCLLQVALKACEILSPIYTYVFLLIRSVVAPPTMVWFSMTLMAATKLPFACRYVCLLSRELLSNCACTAYWYLQTQLYHITLTLLFNMSVLFVSCLGFYQTCVEKSSRLTGCVESLSLVQGHVGFPSGCNHSWQSIVELQTVARPEKAVCQEGSCSSSKG